MIRVLLMLVIIVAATAPSAWAYVDPGTGGAVFGGISYLLALGATALAFVFRPVRVFFARIIPGLRKKHDKPIA